MTEPGAMLGEARTALKFGAVGVIGFAVDAVLLRAGLGFGLTPAIARALSLFCAVQATFAVNGLYVFRCLTAVKLPRQWAGYMLANGFGNLCNYWIFLTLVSLHRPVLSNAYLAMTAGSLTAYAVNFAGTRLLVFGKAHPVGRRSWGAAKWKSVVPKPRPGRISRRREQGR